MIVNQQYLTIEEVAEMLRVKSTTVTAWCRAGKLTAFKQPGGKRWLVNAKELSAMQKQQTKSHGNA